VWWVGYPNSFQDLKYGPAFTVVIGCKFDAIHSPYLDIQLHIVFGLLPKFQEGKRENVGPSKTQWSVLVWGRPQLTMKDTKRQSRTAVPRASAWKNKFIGH